MEGGLVPRLLHLHPVQCPRYEVPPSLPELIKVLLIHHPEADTHSVLANGLSSYVYSWPFWGANLQGLLLDPSPICPQARDPCPESPLLRSLGASQGGSSAHNGLDNNSGNEGEFTALPGLPSSRSHLASITSRKEGPVPLTPGAGVQLHVECGACGSTHTHTHNGSGWVTSWPPTPRWASGAFREKLCRNASRPLEGLQREGRGLTLLEPDPEKTEAGGERKGRKGPQGRMGGGRKQEETELRKRKGRAGRSSLSPGSSAGPSGATVGRKGRKSVLAEGDRERVPTGHHTPPAAALTCLWLGSDCCVYKWKTNFWGLGVQPSRHSCQSPPIPNPTTLLFSCLFV